MTLGSLHSKHVVYCLLSDWSALYLTSLWNWLKDLWLGGHPEPSLLGLPTHSPWQPAGKQQWPSNRRVNSHQAHSSPGGANVSKDVFITVPYFAYWNVQNSSVCLTMAVNTREHCAWCSGASCHRKLWLKKIRKIRSHVTDKAKKTNYQY